MDTVTKTERSRIMSRVKASGNKSTEQRILSLLRKKCLTGWRRNRPLPGKPDFIFPKKKIALFIDGCQWHGCKRHLRMPKSNRRYWKRKIYGNIARDSRTKTILSKLGWRVLRIWEHDIKGLQETARFNKTFAIVKKEESRFAGKKISGDHERD